MVQFPFVSYLGTHCNPHRDECLAFWLFLMFGRSQFDFNPATLRFVFFEDDDDADAFYEMQRGQGRIGLLIGIGTKSSLNEHRPEGRKPDTCAALLMAQRLGVAKRPTLYKLLELATATDNSGSHALDSQSALIQMHHRYGGMDDKEVIQRSFEDFRVIYASSVEFNEQCQSDLVARGELKDVAGIRIGFVQSDAFSMGAWLRTMRQCKICVIRRSNGHVAFFFGQNKADEESGYGQRLMRMVAPAIIRAECRKLGTSKRDADEAAERLSRAIEEKDSVTIPFTGKRWHALGGFALLNGGESHPGRAITTLTDEELVAVVLNALQAL